ncbi:MAG: hypothetical protein ABL897_02565 [Hyphomicrobium sp.]
MAVRKFRSTSSLALSGLAASALFAAGAAMTTSSEAVLRDSFSVALNTAQADRSSVMQKLARSVPVAGTEDYWLSAIRPEGSLPVTKTVAVGDRMALSFAGKNIQLEVADVSEFAPKVTEIDTRSAQTRFVLVTARDVGNAHALPVRFVMEVEHAPTPAVTAEAARTL